VQVGQIIVSGLLVSATGVVIWVCLWASPSRMMNPKGAGEWRTAPGWLRPFVRRGSGPVLYVASIAEAAAVEMIVIGIVRQITPLEEPLISITSWVVAGTWLLGVVAVLVVEWRARQVG
jgi:hypothetical protein